ncbi:hypothetical protein V8C26DRAFT_414771 [Trichoderma gracile]
MRFLAPCVILGGISYLHLLSTFVTSRRAMPSLNDITPATDLLLLTSNYMRYYTDPRVAPTACMLRYRGWKRTAAAVSKDSSGPARCCSGHL